MNTEIKQRWIKALRSGKYAQGRRKLKQVTPISGFEYCCLGVLLDIEEPEGWGEDGIRATIHRHSQGGMPSDGFLAQCGLDYVHAATLARMNDAPRQKSFLEIADYIEATL